jgi:hypothetical protein
MTIEVDMVVLSCKTSIWKVEAGGIVGSRSAWATWRDCVSKKPRKTNLVCFTHMWNQDLET